MGLMYINPGGFMIYELAVVARPETGDDAIANLKTLISEAITSTGGEVMLTDDWGMLHLAQPTSKGLGQGKFIYFIYKSDAAATNAELTRRFGINEQIIKTIMVKVGENKEGADIVKKYKTPFSKTHRGSVLDDVEGGSFDAEKDRKRFVRKKSCWFTAKKIDADWKDPATYMWLVNEFGKISPARVSGVTRQHQKKATTAIKRARQIGIASTMSKDVAYA